MAILLGASALLQTGCNYGFRHDDGSFSSADYKAAVTRSEKGSMAASIQNLVVDNQFGPLVVTGVETDFGWDWDLKCQAATEEKAKEYADKCRLETTEDGSTFRLVMMRPKGNNSNTPAITSQLHVRVPKSAKVEVKNQFGAIEIANLTGPAVSARNQNGPISLKSIAGELDASTAFGSLSAIDIGPAKLKNQNGSITAEHVSGDFVAFTSFASMKVSDVKGTTTLENQNGEIIAVQIEGAVKAHTSFAHMRLENTGPASISNQNGAIEAKKIGGDLDAKTSFNKLWVEDIKGKAALSNQNGEISASKVTGDIKARTSFAKMNLSGDGSLIEARNQNGSIDISAPTSQTAKIDAETSFASIHIWLPEKATPLITAETGFGKVQSDYPVIMKGTMTVEKMNADPATPKISLKTHNGDIHIHKETSKN